MRQKFCIERNDSCAPFFPCIYRFRGLRFSYTNGTCVKIISFNSLPSGCSRIIATFIRNLYAASRAPPPPLSHTKHKYFQGNILRGKNRLGFEESEAAAAGRNYYIKLRRRQNANKGRDCEEYYGAIKSRLRSIRVTKGRICT